MLLQPQVGSPVRKVSSTPSVSTRGGLSVENWFHLNSSGLTPANPSMKKASLLKQSLLCYSFFPVTTVGLMWKELCVRKKTSTLYPDPTHSFTPSVNGSVIYSSLLKDNKPEWLDYGKIRL